MGLNRCASRGSVGCTAADMVCYLSVQILLDARLYFSQQPSLVDIHVPEVWTVFLTLFVVNVMSSSFLMKLVGVVYYKISN